MAENVGETRDEADGLFLRRLRQSVRPKHLIREDQDLAALKDASRSLRDSAGRVEATSPMRREQYSTFVKSDEGYAEQLAPGTFDSHELKTLVSRLLDWVNGALAGRRMVVRDLFLELYDGVVLDELLDALQDVEAGPKKKTVGGVWDRDNLARVLARVDTALGNEPGQTPHTQWSLDRIHGKEVVATLHLLVALVSRYRPQVKLPDNVVIRVNCVQHTRDKMQSSSRHEQITGDERARRTAARLSFYDDRDDQGQEDAFDKLFAQAPERVEAVKLSLLTFANKHLSQLQWYHGNNAAPPVRDLTFDLQDGLVLIHLLSVLGGYFVPIYHYHPQPREHIQKITNMGLVFRLMSAEGLATRGRPDDIVNQELKATLRLLYAIFAHYKHAQVRSESTPGEDWPAPPPPPPEAAETAADAAQPLPPPPSSAAVDETGTSTTV